MAAPDGMSAGTASIPVAMWKDLAEPVQRLAEENGRSAQGEIRRALRGHLDREKAGEAPVMQDLDDELEAIPVASPQKIAALRRKHRKGDAD